jgi:malate dehydrogenase (oxaloacetate-decarboxylating)(NADP+)
MEQIARRLFDHAHGAALLDDPVTTHGTAFTVSQRRERGLEGLLPHSVETMSRQAERVAEQYNRRLTDLDRYLYLIELCDRNETLFYQVVMSNPARFIPILYDPADR